LITVPDELAEGELTTLPLAFGANPNNKNKLNLKKY
tara:strand:- start:996 stop:1103 length:108 start_codon:yes stop_codon:yes gene_type:complete